MRKWFEKFKAYMRFRFLLTASNPKNFEEFWSLQLTRSQFFSALIALLLIGGFLVSILFGGLFSGDTFGGLSDTERDEMRAMRSSLETMATKTRQQEAYVNDLKNVLNGTVSADSLKTLTEAKIVDPKSIDTARSESERLLGQKVSKLLGNEDVTYRIASPINGSVLVEKFNARKHPFVVLTSPFDSPLFSFAEGVVLLGKEDSQNQLVLSFDGGIVVVIRNLSKLEVNAGERTRIGQILARSKKNTNIRMEVRKGQTAINPAEIFDIPEKEVEE